jgi:hypothetical protein
LGSIEGEEVARLVASIAKIGFKYRTLSEYRIAEKWYRCIVTATEGMRDRRPVWILAACLGVILCLNMQGRYAEARGLHQDLYIKVQREFGTLHPLALLSKAEWCTPLRWFGTQEEEEKIWRELLQSHLSLQGTAHNESITAIHQLGLLLGRQERFLESEQLMIIAINLRTEQSVVLLEPYQGCPDMNDRDTLLTMLHLAHSFNMNGKHNQSRDLLVETKNRFQNILQRESRMYFHYQNEFARTQRLAGKLKNSEEILRDLMRCHESSMSPNRRVSILRELGEILNEAGHRNEATSWFEKEFIVLLENVGLDNPIIKISCKRLGLCYARMGLYNEAMLYFEWMIERLNLEDP